MARQFDIPSFYRSAVISTIKRARSQSDHRKKDLAPTEIDLGPIVFKIARHFGFCYGVENAIEIAYRAVEENPGKRVFLLSEMIHNPRVNRDLNSRGVNFILSTEGRQLFPFEQLKADDVVIVPAFGTTVELFEKLSSLGINPLRYDATCPFVEKVWKRSAELGARGYTVIIHGKHTHEETRATFSHARLAAPTLTIRDMAEARLLARYLRHELSIDQFERDFAGRYSAGFKVDPHLNKIGVVNQTTMLATETQEIAELLKQTMIDVYGTAELSEHFADTRDTLCYATQQNQEAVTGLIQSGGDLAIVVGGYNSSNTSHLVELCEQRVPTYHIEDAAEILSRDCIKHLDFHSGEIRTKNSWLPTKSEPVQIILTAGASCPDALVDEVITKIASFYGVQERIAAVLEPYSAALGENLPLVSIARNG